MTCDAATTFRQNNLPELYLLNSYAQFDYENALATCYLGATSFVRSVNLRGAATTTTTTSFSLNNYPVLNYILNLFHGIRRTLFSA